MMANIREQLVKKVVKEQFNDIVGGYENSILDGLIEEMPSHEELANQIYQEVMSASMVVMGGQRMAVKKDIRFIGGEKIREYIEKKLTKEGY
jgi:VIT1/CCC1 family predicted Fe2+/Mn2+ transporter